MLMRRQFFGARSRLAAPMLSRTPKRLRHQVIVIRRRQTPRVQRSFRYGISRPTNRSWIFLDLRRQISRRVDLADAPPTHWFCAWAPQEDHLLIVNALDLSACLQVDLPEGHVSNVGSALVAAATRIASGPKSRKLNFSDRAPNLSAIDTHFISSHECYVTVNIDSGSDTRRVDLYFQINAGGNSLVFERSEPYPNSNQPLGASILAGRQAERLYQTLRGLLDEDDRQLLTLQQQSWLGGFEALANYEDRIAFARMRITELRQRLKDELQRKR